MNRSHIAFALVLVGAFCLPGLFACATPGKTACAVVDLAHAACSVLPIRYLGPDGREVTEEVPASELRQAAQRSRAARLQGAAMGSAPAASSSGSAP